MSLDRIDISAFQAMIRERKFDNVERGCETILALPDCTDDERKVALHFMGTIQYMRGNVGRGIDYFKRVLALDPKYTDSAISLSVLYNDIGKYEEAKRVYNIANQSLQLKRAGADEELDRKFSLKHIELGDLYFKFHRYDDALDDYSRAARLDPRQLDIRIKLAKVYARKGFTTRAVQELQQLCHENPDYVPARLHLGLMYFSQGNIIDARLEWERAQNLDPSNPELHTYLEMAERATETSV